MSNIFFCPEKFTASEDNTLSNFCLFDVDFDRGGIVSRHTTHKWSPSKSFYGSGAAFERCKSAKAKFWSLAADQALPYERELSPDQPEILPTSTGGYHPNGRKANHELTIKLDKSVGAGQDYDDDWA